MKKKLLIFLSLLMLSISLVGCGSDDPEPEYVNGNEVVHFGNRTFLKIPTYEDGEDVHIMLEDVFLFVDTETSVQYLYLDGYRRAVMEVIVDADGKPILYEGELE